MLRGRKVMLVKRGVPAEKKRFVYGIHLQEGREPGTLLGLTTQQLTTDLLHLLWAKGYGLPGKMFNLRITDVVTFGSPEPEASAARRYAQSGLWLGVQIYGTGDFKPFRRTH